jgi:SAM-dependent methyltransferase
MLYDTIGTTYSAQRIPDASIARAIQGALADAVSVANVGAGTGSYEPRDRFVVAVEPSMAMIRQRAPGAAPAVLATAEELPFRDGSVSAAMAVLTLHHWADLSRGLQELGRVATDRIAILTWDPDAPAFWLTHEYFPEMVDRDRQRFPSASQIAHSLGSVTSHVIPIRHDCTDGFLGAYWRKPSAYLSPVIRSGMSGFVGIPGVEEGLEQLRADLDSGTWERRFGHLRSQESLDIGYRLMVVELQ